MKWVTRERPKIDRIACPWLIQRFIDPKAEFLYVPTDNVLEVAKDQDAIPYDIAEVELTHEGPKCSFDKFLSKYSLTPALERLAMYDALYSWCQSLHSERHGWDPKATVPKPKS